MDRLFFTVQNLLSLGCAVSVDVRSIDERTSEITLHYQTGEPIKGLIGEDNVRIFHSPGCAVDHLFTVFSSLLGISHA